MVNSSQFPTLYEGLGIDFDMLGCIMLNIDQKNLPQFKNPESLYENSNHSLASGEAHITLLFGLMKSGTEWKKQVDEVLAGWTCGQITVDSVSFFDITDPDSDSHYCIIAKIKVTPQLKEGHTRLQLLPHVDTFPEYIPHMTIAYVLHDDKIRDDVIDYYQARLAGKTLTITGINYGDIPEGLEKSMYCVSCKDKKEPIKAEAVQMKNGRPATKGTCPDCGTGMFRIGEGS